MDFNAWFEAYLGTAHSLNQVYRNEASNIPR